ncbi:AMP-binding protein, partial [Ilumatobacter sp.]
MTAILVAIDLPGGPGFVEELQRIWRDGNAAFPVDQRLPAAAKAEVCRAMRVGAAVEQGDALVVATSGSTGTPKGVVLTHDAVAASAAATTARIGVGMDDHWLACLPLSHVGG